MLATTVNLLRQDILIPPLFSSKGGSIPVTHNAAYSRYNALQLQFMQRMTQGLHTLVSYSLAKSADTASDEALKNSPTAKTVNLLALPSPAPSDFDARHVFSAAVSYELPAPSNGVMNK